MDSHAIYDLSKGLAKAIRESKKIVILIGAGVSTSAGIPDFRSPDSGIYALLEAKYGLRDAQELFNLESFLSEPDLFWSCFNEFSTKDRKATLTHRFIAFLEKIGKLQMLYSQNVDGLEEDAGISRVVLCHGTAVTCTCLSCGSGYTTSQFKSQFEKGTTPDCPSCLKKASESPDTEPTRRSERSPVTTARRRSGLLKPDIVFFGESLASLSITNLMTDLASADLVLVMGTTLSVAPLSHLFAYLPEEMKGRSRQRSWYINKTALNHCPFDYSIIADCDTVFGQVWALLEQPGTPMKHEE